MARPPRDSPSSSAKAKPKRELPSPEAVVERESRQKNVAIYTAIAAAIITAVAVLVENLVQGSIPDVKATTTIDTFQNVIAGRPVPASYLTAIGEWKLDHVLETSVAAVLRGIAFLLMIPMTLLLLRGARERGGQLAKFLEPFTVVGLILMMVGPVAVAALEPGIWHDARAAGFTPGAIRDSVLDSSLRTYLSAPVSIGSLLIGVPLALASLQAHRIGLLPPMIGYMGVLVGLLFVFPFESTGLLRAVWFGAVAFIVSGRGAGGLPPAWANGVAVERAPRQPPAPRERKGKGDSGKKPSLTK